jgi:hypothetical protein
MVMDMRTGYVVVMMLQEEWRREAALERAAAASRRPPPFVPQIPRRRGWLVRVFRRPLVQPAADAG